MPTPEFDREFHLLLAESEGMDEGAPSSLKARLYSALIRAQQEGGPLASLDASVAAGHGVCLFERLVQVAPVGEKVKSQFFCEVCHARLLAEHFENPPIFWSHCPYAGFKRP